MDRGAQEDDLLPDAVDALVAAAAQVRAGDGPPPEDLHPDFRYKSLAYRLRRVAHRLELEMRRELRGHGIDLWDLELLATLLRAPDGRLAVGELMAAVELTSGTVSHRISRAQERGWVARDRDGKDRRGVLVTLTAAGRRRALEVLDVKTQVERAVLDVLDDEDLSRTDGCLRRIARRLDERAAQ